MSDDERSDGSSDSEDLETTGLIATRQKRATAGNLYATLRANLDDEELQKELLAEDEGDAGDYEGSDAGDDDEAFESSSDEEDAGPPQEGIPEDLEGEKALKRQERSEAKKKRKVHEARLKLPAWRKQVKRVKLADDVKTEDGSGVEKPKKRSERSNWLPTAADAPMRQSRRSLAVANREVVHANLKQSAVRSENQKRIIKNALEREKKEKITASLTQEERLKKCEKIERETAREFGRWEREEAERQRLREEALAAKRRRGIDGPVVRVWSGSVLWEGERIKVKRVAHGSQEVDEIVERKADPVPARGHGDETSTTEASTPAPTNHNTTATTPADTQAKSTPEPVPKPAPAAQSEETPTVPWLQGIQEYAAQPAQMPPQPTYTPSAPSINNTPTAPPVQQPTYPPAPPQPQIYHGWPPGSHQFPLHPPPPSTTAPPSIPLIREQAQRTLLILSSFPALETPSTTTKRTPKSKQPETTPLDPTPLTTTLLPSSHPTFTAEESRYLLTRPRRRIVPGSNNTAGTPTFTTTSSSVPVSSGPKYEVPLPPPPTKTKCAVTSWPAKFRDPKTNLGYADMHQYKVIQRAVAGGCLWSGLLGAWVGPSYGRMGRPAKGVPEGFAGGVTPSKGKVKVEGGG
jgi:vacuolar protein sorting-associated protein 72